MSESGAVAVLLQRMCSAARAEACAAAERLVAIGELVSLRLAEDAGATDLWVVDATDAVTLEVAAALGISRDLAASHVRYAHALRFSLPRLGRAFIAGDVDEAVFRACVFRTGLIVDEDTLAMVDAELAITAPRWGSCSRTQLAARIDRVVAKVDLDAVRRRRDRVAGRDVVVGDVDNGLTEITAVAHRTRRARLRRAPHRAGPHRVRGRRAHHGPAPLRRGRGARRRRGPPRLPLRARPSARPPVRWPVRW